MNTCKDCGWFDDRSKARKIAEKEWHDKYGEPNHRGLYFPPFPIIEDRCTACPTILPRRAKDPACMYFIGG